MNNEWLMHYNHNHDKLGRFAKSPFGRRSKNPNTNTTATESEPDNATNKAGKGFNVPSKALKIGATAAVAALALGGGYYLYKTGALDNAMVRGHNAISSVLGFSGSEPPNDASPLFDPEKAAAIAKQTGLNVRKSPGTLLENIKVNPGYINDRNGPLRNNCSHASIAWVLNELGMKVKARGMEDDFIDSGITLNEAKRYFKGMKWDPRINIPKGADSEQIKNYLGDQIKSLHDGDCAGIWRIGLSGGGIGHYMGWKVENGKVTFVDPQREASDCDAYFKAMASGRINVADIARLDHLEVNPRYITRAVTNA